MKANIKSMWVNNPAIDLNGYCPDVLENFGIWVEFRIGAENSVNADDYRVFVCTPEWLCQNIWEPKWGRHMLIVRLYDLQIIKKCISDYILSCEGEGWEVIAKKIARNLSWEFEDYQNPV